MMIRGNDFDNTILVIELAPCTRNGNVCKDRTLSEIKKFLGSP